MRYEGDIYRPPGEWRSYLLQCTVGCSYNGCTYCGMYKNKQYHVRPLADILEDIDMAREHFTDFGSFPLGMPSVTRVFLCDGDAIAMDTDDLLTILRRLYEAFPRLERVTTYAGPISTLKKTPEELKALHAGGLGRVYLGVETGWDTVLQEAKDAGIPVVLVDRGVTADPSLYVTHIFADALKEGANAFNWVDEYMTAEGKTPRAGGEQFQVAILEGTVGSSVAADRLQGFTDAMAESPNSGKYNVICSQTGEYTRAKGMEVMESFLKSDGDKIDILFSCNGDMALGAIQAIEAAGLKPGEDIVIVSIDAAKGEFNAMIEGKMNCAVEHTPNFGETLMETAKKIVAGEEVPATIELEEGIFPADIAEQEMPNRTY